VVKWESFFGSLVHDYQQNENLTSKHECIYYCSKFVNFVSFADYANCLDLGEDSAVGLVNLGSAMYVLHALDDDRRRRLKAMQEILIGLIVSNAILHQEHQRAFAEKVFFRTKNWNGEERWTVV